MFFAALQSLLQNIFTILSNVKSLLFMTPAFLFVIDLALKGQMGFINYMLQVMGQLFAVVKSGGWEIVIVFLLLTYLFKKRLAIYTT